MRQLPSRVATDGPFWCVATVMVPITLALVIGLAAFVFGVFRMDPHDPGTISFAAMVAVVAVLAPPVPVVMVGVASPIRAGFALGIAVGSLVAVYGAVLVSVGP